MKFMLIRRFFMYFAEFSPNFLQFFDDFFVLLPKMSIKKTSIT